SSMSSSRACSAASSNMPPGATCRVRHSSSTACCAISPAPITRTLRRGVRSDSVGRQVRAGTCAWISIDATHGKQLRPSRAMKLRRYGRTLTSPEVQHEAPAFVVDEALHRPRAIAGRAPDVFRVGGWVPMREYGLSEAVDFVIVGTGAGGGTLACRLAELGFSVVALDAGGFFRPLEDFASDETEQSKLYWLDRRIVDGANPITMGGK